MHFRSTPRNILEADMPEARITTLKNDKKQRIIVIAVTNCLNKAVTLCSESFLIVGRMFGAPHKGEQRDGDGKSEHSSHSPAAKKIIFSVTHDAVYYSLDFYLGFYFPCPAANPANTAQ